MVAVLVFKRKAGLNLNNKFLLKLRLMMNNASTAKTKT